MLTKTYKPIALRDIPPFYSSVRDGYPGEKTGKIRNTYQTPDQSPAEEFLIALVMILHKNPEG